MRMKIAAGLLVLTLGACSSPTRRVQDEDAWLRSESEEAPAGEPVQAPADPDSWPAVSDDFAPSNTSRARLESGLILLKQGDLVRAAAAFAEVRDGPAETANVDRVAAAKFLGVIALKRERYQEAAAHSRQAVLLGSQATDREVLKHVAEAHYNLGMSFYYQDEYKDSYTELRRYSELAAPAGIRLGAKEYFQLGLTAYLSEDFEDAREFFRRSSPAFRAQAADILEDPEIKDLNY